MRHLHIFIHLGLPKPLQGRYYLILKNNKLKLEINGCYLGYLDGCCRACWALCRLTSGSKCGPLPLLPLTSFQHSAFLYIFAEHLTHATYHQNPVLELRRQEEYHFLQTQIMITVHQLQNLYSAFRLTFENEAKGSRNHGFYTQEDTE